MGCNWGKHELILQFTFSEFYLQVRERPKVVKTGPYSIVRHPGYGSVILNTR
jgi:protein-S-isoprenylcysteine O-methyltransferase Ste14